MAQLHLGWGFLILSSLLVAEIVMDRLRQRMSSGVESAPAGELAARPHLTSNWFGRWIGSRIRSA